MCIYRKKEEIFDHEKVVFVILFMCSRDLAVKNEKYHVCYL